MTRELFDLQATLEADVKKRTHSIDETTSTEDLDEVQRKRDNRKEERAIALFERAQSAELKVVWLIMICVSRRQGYFNILKLMVGLASRLRKRKPLSLAVDQSVKIQLQPTQDLRMEKGFLICGSGVLSVIEQFLYL